MYFARKQEQENEKIYEVHLSLEFKYPLEKYAVVIFFFL